MGIDWEYLLNCEDGERLADAYNDAIPEPDDYPYDDPECNDDIEENEDAGQEEEANTEDLLDRPLVELSDDEKIAAFNLRDCCTPYLITILKGEKNSWKGNDTTLTGMDDNQYPACDRLFHANSIKTSLRFIERKALFSREFGENEGLQTYQRSDSFDRQLGVYNDIFFDNIDIPYRSGTNRSAYGPVMFVFKIDILKNQKIRILKFNPWNGRDQDDITYNQLFFSGIEEIKSILCVDHHYNTNRVNFLENFEHHTTVFNTSELPFGNNLDFIYVEKCYDGSGRENELKNVLENALNEAGLDVPVIIRKDDPDTSFYGLAAEAEELWSFPQDIE